MYDGCLKCHKTLCECVEYQVEYENAGDMIFCIECFEKQDPDTQLYKYFREKYNEQLSLSEIQKIIKSKQNN